jgi:uncharacterized membrane protein
MDNVQDYADYFFAPGYTLEETLVYSIILVIVAYLVFIFLKKKVEFNKKFVLAIFPLLIAGSVLRVLEDAKIVQSLLFVTPFLFFWGTPLVILILLLFLKIEKKFGIPYFKPMFLLGLLITTCFLLALKFVNLSAGLIVAILFLPWLVILSFKFWKPENRAITAIHMFDATVTSTAINFFGYGEQHVLPSFFIGLFGTWSFIPLKFFVIVLVLVLIDKFSEDKKLKNFLKICIAIIGMFTASRDFVRLLTLV